MAEKVERIVLCIISKGYSVMDKSYEYFLIEKRGGRLCAVFGLEHDHTTVRYTRDRHGQEYVATRIRGKSEVAYDEESLHARIDELRKQGLDASMSEQALTDLRAATKRRSQKKVGWASPAKAIARMRGLIC